jgi:hypothetical protein
MKEIHTMDHAFSVEADVVTLNDIEERLVFEGYIGKIMKIRFANNLLEINGLEGNLKINLKEEELEKLLNKRICGKRRLWK